MCCLTAARGTPRHAAAPAAISRAEQAATYDDSVRAAVIAAGDCPKALLARGVPDLQLDGLAVELDGADFLRRGGGETNESVRTFWGTAGCDRQAHKVHADGTDVALCVCVISKAEKQAGLSDARVTDEKQLE